MSVNVSVNMVAVIYNDRMPKARMNKSSRGNGSDTEKSTTARSDREKWESVWRVVFPNPDDPDAPQTLPLYATRAGQYHVPTDALDERSFTHTANVEGMSRAQVRALVRSAQVSATSSDSSLSGVSFTRTSCTLPPATGVSLCTYFNAFPASYWRYWTGVRQVCLVVHASGSGTITLRKSNCRGLSSVVARLHIAPTAASAPAAPVTTRATATQQAHASHTYTATVDLTGVIDGGMVWFDAQADSTASLTVSDAAWQVPISVRTAAQPGRASIVITTFNREQYCLRQLETLATAPNLLSHVQAIRCIDQGTHPLTAHTRFNVVSATLGTRLQYIQQANLGGSGGFSRGMIETVSAHDSTAALLLDDDAIIEPEALLRAIQFEDYATHPLIVGAGMLHLDDRSVLYTQAERLNPRTLLHEQYVKNHDFALDPLATSPRLHRRVSSGHNGWWMSLIPVPIMEKIGYALPSFIKFDDIDYSARARENGLATVSLPGVAIWHQAWHGKNESRSWQEYFNQRNRYMYALLHEQAANKRVPAMILRHCTAMGLSFIYSGIAQDEMALTDLLRGPEFIVDSYTTAMKRIAALRAQYADTHSLPDTSSLPLPQIAFTDLASHPISQQQLSRLSRSEALHAWLRPRSGAHDQQPATEIDAVQSDWKSFVGITSALVASPDANSVAWLRRDDKLYRHLTWKTVKAACAIVRQWPRLHTLYSSAHLGSREMWERIFKASQASQA